MTQLMLLKFNLNLDFSGLVWGFANMLLGAIGILVGGIAGLITLVNRNEPRASIFQKALSTVYGAMIPCAAAVAGFMTLYAFEGDRNVKQFLDGIALLVGIAGIVGMGIFIVARNKRIQRPTSK